MAHLCTAVQPTGRRQGRQEGTLSQLLSALAQSALHMHNIQRPCAICAIHKGRACVQPRDWKITGGIFLCAVQYTS